MRHFLEVDDLSHDELRTVLELAANTTTTVGTGAGTVTTGTVTTGTATTGSQPLQGQPLQGKGVALVFEKASNRTRNSMEMAVAQLGGHPVYIRGEEVGIDTREPAEDVIRTLAGYHALVAARVIKHESLERMSACDVVPVINLLSDQAHPMQALADLLTITQHFGSPDFGSPVSGSPDSGSPDSGNSGDSSGSDSTESVRVAFVGDANNVWRSLAIGCAMLGFETVIAAPARYAPSAADLQRIQAAAASSQPASARATAPNTAASSTPASSPPAASPPASVLVTEDPIEAVSGAHVVYTDVWTSMGQESEASQRQADFESYRVDEKLMSHTRSDSIFMHCLPAHRGQEVTAEVLESARSVVWQQAENRMHAARGLLAFWAASA